MNSIANQIKDYSKLVYDLAVRRELIVLGQEISSRAQSIKVDEQPEEQIILAEQNLYKIGDSGKSETGFKSFLKALSRRTYVALKHQFGRKGCMVTVRFHYVVLRQLDLQYWRKNRSSKMWREVDLLSLHHPKVYHLGFQDISKRYPSTNGLIRIKFG